MEDVRERIASAAQRAGRHAGEITLVAVSKTISPEVIHAGYDAGLRHFGESRIQEMEAKRPELAGLDAAWHFIGHLQANKVRRAVRLFDRVDSVDSLGLAQRLDSSAAEEGKVVPHAHVRLGDRAQEGIAAQRDSAATFRHRGRSERRRRLPGVGCFGLYDRAGAGGGRRTNGMGGIAGNEGRKR